MGKFVEKLNGKKIPIAMTVTILTTIIGAAVAYGELTGRVTNNVKEIDKLKPLIEQTAVIQANTKDLKEDFLDFRQEQRKVNVDHRKLMMKIYDKVK